jgi:uncharacterized protein VirK/YbjX
MAFLTEFERQHSLSAARPETVRKPLRNFAVHHLSSAQRVALLMSHYSITAKTLPACILSTLWSGSTVTVGSLTGKNGKYLLTLGPDRHCGKEGEFTFTLAAEDGFDLAKLTFTFAVREEVTPERILLIGGLQGPSSHLGASAKERIIKATRDLSGLRPKMVVFLAAEALALGAGAKALHAVSNLTHTINGDARYQRRKRYADYDSFWIERGGTPTEWGFSIPLQIGPRAHRSGRNEQRARVGVLVRQLLSAADPDKERSDCRAGLNQENLATLLDVVVPQQCLGSPESTDPHTTADSSARVRWSLATLRANPLHGVLISAEI